MTPAETILRQAVKILEQADSDKDVFVLAYSKDGKEGVPGALLVGEVSPANALPAVVTILQQVANITGLSVVEIIHQGLIPALAQLEEEESQNPGSYSDIRVHPVHDNDSIDDIEEEIMEDPHDAGTYAQEQMIPDVIDFMQDMQEEEEEAEENEDVYFEPLYYGPLAEAPFHSIARDQQGTIIIMNKNLYQKN